MGRRIFALAALASVALAACDGAPAPAADGGVPDGGEGGIVVAEAAPPALAPCPAGWNEVTGPSGIASCDPWPSTGYDAHCAFDQAHFAGTPGCARIGTACAADGWPSDLPTDRPIVYVDVDAPAGGDGASRDHPLRSIAAGIAAAPMGGVIALGTGHYDELARLRDGQTLWGACVDGTRLASSVEDQDHGVVDLAGAGSGVRNLGIDPSPRVGVYVVGTDATIEDVATTGTALAGIWVDQGPVSVRNVVTRDVHFFQGSHWGSAIEIEYGATMTLDHVVVDGAAYNGVFADVGSTIVATDLVVRGSHYSGLYVQAGSTLTVTRGVVLEAVGFGVALTGQAHFGATDLVIDGVALDDPGSGTGIYVEDASHATLTRAHILHHAHLGLALGQTGTDVTLTDALVEQSGTGDNGTGIFAVMGGALHATRVHVDHTTTAGVYLSDTGTSLDGTDLVVRGTRGEPIDGLGGNALLLFDGASAMLSRVRLEDARLVSFALGGVGTTAVVSDLTIADTGPQDADGHFGRAVELQDGASLQLTRAILERNRNAGFFVAASSLSATDLIVRDTTSDPSDGSVGVGLWAQEDATVVLENARVERSHFVGVAAVGASVTASHLVVDGVDAAACGGTTCPELAGGFGITSVFGGVASISGFEVRGAVLCGVVVGEDDPARAPTAMDLDTGVVATSPVGACVQTTAFDTARLHHAVTFVDVGVPLQATTYTLPMSLR